jgi:transcription antitermination protein NusB
MGNFNPSSRRKARRLVLQALYQWVLTNDPIDVIASQFAECMLSTRVDKAYFLELLHYISAHAQELDEMMSSLLDRPIDQINPIELAILRIGIYELKYRPDVPYRVVINEELELAKMFGAEESHKFINGILDALAKQLRSLEINSVK